MQSAEMCRITQNNGKEVPLMVITVLYYLLLFYALILFLYGVFKVIWYTVVMLSLPVKMKRLQKKGARVERLRSLWDMVFGRKGDAAYYVTVGAKRYEVTVLSFISIHGRWIFEMRTSKFRIEARRLRSHFYSEKKHRGIGGSDIEYKNEFRISRKELFLTPVEEEYAGQILLLYPTPKRIVCVDHRYRDLASGDTVEGHTVMNIRDFISLIRRESASDNN